MLKQKWTPLLLVFVVITIATLAAGNWLTEHNVDTAVVLGGNALLFGASLLAMALYASALKSKSYGFVRKVTTGFMVKFFVLVVGAMLYFYFAESVNKAAIFICMVLYLIYNFLGTSQVVKKNNDSHPDHAVHKPHRKAKHKRHH